jgi:hypothetical protein
MPRLWVGNFDFEHQLAAPGRGPTRGLCRLYAELACAWLAVAEDGDRLWTPEAIAVSDWEPLQAAGAPRVIGTHAIRPLPGEVVTPWGWTAALAKEFEAPCDPAIIERVNARRWSAALEQEWSVGLSEACWATTSGEVELALRPFTSGERPWVIKADYGMSGRERLLGRGAVRREQAGWIARRLKQGGVSIEPWVESLGEAGLQFEIDATGDVIPLGVVEMLTSRAGQYAGSWFMRPAGTGHDWRTAIETATRAVARMAELGYRGPVGIDAMWYRDAAGVHRCRPLQDINARWTMGRLALGWRRHFPDLHWGYWWHGSQVDFQAGGHLLPARDMVEHGPPRLVRRMSPQRIGGQPARHVMVVVGSHG